MRNECYIVFLREKNFPSLAHTPPTCWAQYRKNADSSRQITLITEHSHNEVLIIHLLNVNSEGVSRMLVLYDLCSSFVYRGEFHLMAEIFIIELHTAVGWE